MKPSRSLGIVSSATPASGSTMEVVSVTDLAVGNTPFTDRKYHLTVVGNYPKECFFIRGANDDKDTLPHEVQTSIDVRFPATVYLDFWGGSVHLSKVSTWIGDWRVAADATPTTFDRPGKTSRGPGIVMKKNFDAGIIELMGNNGDGHGSYYAFVCPQGNLPC